MLFYCYSLAASYLNDVILKEGLAAILEAITTGGYDEAGADGTYYVNACGQLVAEEGVHNITLNN